MISKLELVRDTDIVFARWKGPITAEERHHLRKEILKKCNLHNTKRFIVDLRDQVNEISAKESYEFGKTFRREMPGFKLAVIVKLNCQTEKIIADTINRGDVIMKEFYSYEPALEWIKNVA